MSDASIDERRFTGRHFLIIIIGFFSVVIGVNVWLSVVAYRSWTGVVVDDSYASGLDFNEKVQLAREQEALGWKGGLSYSPGTIRLDLVDGSGKPLDVADVTVVVTEHIGAASDQTLTMTRNADGSYAASAVLPSGRWDAIAMAKTTPHGVLERRAQFVVD